MKGHCFLERALFSRKGLVLENGLCLFEESARKGVLYQVVFPEKQLFPSKNLVFYEKNIFKSLVFQKGPCLRATFSMKSLVDGTLFSRINSFCKESCLAERALFSGKGFVYWKKPRFLESALMPRKGQIFKKRIRDCFIERFWCLSKGRALTN